MNGNYILALETATNVCSVCLANGDFPLVEHTIYIPNSADQMLAQIAKRILDDVHLTFDRLVAVAVSSGPGSFTGLRIGAAFAKGLCFDGKIKLVPVPTLSAMAYACLELAQVVDAERIVVVLHSHKDIYYFQFFDTEGNEKTQVNLCTIDELREVVKDNDFLYSPSSVDIQRVKKLDKTNLLTAKHIAQLGWKLFTVGTTVDPAEFVPSYHQQFTPKLKGK